VDAARRDARPPIDNIETVERIPLEGERPCEPRGQGVKYEVAIRRSVLRRGFGNNLVDGEGPGLIILLGGARSVRSCPS
jgi:hypothetical protein